MVLVLSMCWFCGCSGSGESKLALKWRALCRAGGALEGSHHWNEDEDIYYESVLLNDEWQEFLAMKPADTVPYLVTRLSETNLVEIDVTPWGKATEGQMAVYAMGYLLRTNWFKCPEGYPSLARYRKIHLQAPRNVEPFLLSDKVARSELSNFFVQAAINYRPPEPEEEYAEE